MQLYFITLGIFVKLTDAKPSVKPEELRILSVTKMLHASVFLIVCLTPMISSVTVSVSNSKDFRMKRQINGLPLVFPYGATYKLLLGFATPVPADYSLLFAVNFQYQYLQFQNISELSRYYFIKEVSRDSREVEHFGRKDDRLVFYRSVADLMISKGMNGLDCLLRAICEAAQYPVKEEGLVGEILHILLTPDYHRTPFDNHDPELEKAMAIYKDAAVAGRQMFNCASVYNECPEGTGVMELITKLRDE